MLLMWLGSLTLLLSGLWLSQRALQNLLGALREHALDSTTSRDFATMLRGCFLYVFGSASEVEPQSVGFLGYNYRLAHRRPALLMMCLSLLGLWWPLALCWGYLQYNGLLVLGVAAILWMMPWNSLRNKNRRSSMIQFFFGTGLFFFGAELLVKNASLLINILGQTSFTFLIVEKSLPALAVLALIGCVLAYFIKVEFFSVVLGLVLMMSGSITYIGALALFLGERLARLLEIGLWSQKVNSSAKLASRQYIGFSGLGLVIGFLIVLSMAQSFQWGTIFGVEPSVRNQQFMVGIMSVLFFQFVAQMAWGHFASQKKEEDVQEVKYLDFSAAESYLSRVSREWFSLGIETRLSLIQKSQEELKQVPSAQVPAALQQKVDEESKRLEEIFEEIKSS